MNVWHHSVSFKWLLYNSLFGSKPFIISSHLKCHSSPSLLFPSPSLCLSSPIHPTFLSMFRLSTLTPTPNASALTKKTSSEDDDRLPQPHKRILQTRLKPFTLKRPLLMSTQSCNTDFTALLCLLLPKGLSHLKCFCLCGWGLSDTSLRLRKFYHKAHKNVFIKTAQWELMNIGLISVVGRHV